MQLVDIGSNAVLFHMAETVLCQGLQLHRFAGWLVDRAARVVMVYAVHQVLVVDPAKLHFLSLVSHQQQVQLTLSTCSQKRADHETAYRDSCSCTSYCTQHDLLSRHYKAAHQGYAFAAAAAAATWGVPAEWLELTACPDAEVLVS